MNIKTSIKTTSAATAKFARHDAALKHQRSDNAIIKKRSYLYCEFMNEADAACNFFRESMKKATRIKTKSRMNAKK